MASGLGNLRSILLSYRDRWAQAYHSPRRTRKWSARAIRGAGAGLAALAVLPGVSATSRAAGPLPCTPDGGETVRINGVAADWSLTLSDGRQIRLIGAEPPAEEGGAAAVAAAARARLAAWLSGREAMLVPAASGLDRWGRLDGLVFAGTAPADGGAVEAVGQPLSVALAMVDAGFARARVDAGGAACWPALLAAEKTAREAGIGLWSDPASAILRPDDAAALAAALGTMVVVEGRVRRVGHGRTRLYVGLGEKGAEVTFSVRNQDLFILDQLGLNEHGMAGTSVRLRGDLEDHRGFSIDVSDARQVEVLGRAGPEVGR